MFYGPPPWRLAFPEANAEVLPRLSSDHHPILVQCGPAPPKGSRPFRFEVAWLTHPAYEGVVQEAWDRGGSVAGRLEVVKDRSHAFNKETFRSIFFRKYFLEARIKGIQLNLELVDSAYLSHLNNSLMWELHTILLQEDVLWF